MRARAINKLSATKVAKLSMPGYHHDGGGLYLQVSPQITKSWIFRFSRGRDTWMGLGPYPDVSLAAARTEASKCRGILRDGKNPLRERDAQRMADRLAEARSVTLSDCITAYIDAHEAGWRNAKHRDQWRTTLATYVEQDLGRLPVQEIDTALVLKVLKPIWSEKTETATRVRQRIEAVLDWATVSKYRSGDNPARWKGHLDKLLPKPSKVRTRRHHAALPFAEVGGFMPLLRAEVGTPARCLEFVILTATRTGEAIGALWDEVDGEVWTIPAARMKAGKAHAVPLSSRALAILKEQRQYGSEWVFPGRSADKPMSNMAMLQLLKRMRRPDLTVHGFRSSFRDWCAEQTNYPREVAEQALAHTLKDRTEAAYRRGDLLEKRRRLMADWARYVDKPSTKASVTRIRR